MKTAIFSTFAAFWAIAGLFAGPKISIVTGDDPHELVTLSAEQLSAQFQQVFEADVQISAGLPVVAKNLILLGSPATNAAIPESAWPDKLSLQEHFLKSTDSGLIVGGDDPAAGYWAACELGRHFGFRYLLHGDFPPKETPEFSLDGLDVKFVQNVKIRAWKTIGRGPASQESWGLTELQNLLRQLAKLKFNQVILAMHPDQPFFDSGAEEKRGVLWNGEEFRVDGDTAGRPAFGRAKIFENPDFAGKATYIERLEAGYDLANGVIHTAQALGMKARIDTDKAHLETARKTYENADWIEYQLFPVALGQKDGGLLPELATSALPERLKSVREYSEGFALTCAIPGDHNHAVHYLSRVAFDAEITPRAALDDLVEPICGEGVAERVSLAFEAIEKASALIAENDENFAVPHAEMFVEHYQSSEAVPEWWAEAKGHFVTAVNEMYRANTRARGGARDFTLHHAKRFTFGLHYLTAVETARAAGIAKSQANADAQLENLELSVEAMHNALGIYADVARDNSDRGVIAVLNQYGYRPLLKILDSAP